MIQGTITLDLGTFQGTEIGLVGIRYQIENGHVRLLDELPCIAKMGFGRRSYVEAVVSAIRAKHEVSVPEVVLT